MQYSSSVREATRFVSPAFRSRRSETESVEGRQFAMMAARGLDRLCLLWIFSSGFFNAVVSGSENGMSEVLFASIIYE